ncbi:MAG: hypothetical protein BWK79_10135 [Beggiatoa sp. IS2]|nr:MAG: hypothetical protein BWK79_10135 [Beggiatoa sp. IS2]
MTFILESVKSSLTNDYLNRYMSLLDVPYSSLTVNPFVGTPRGYFTTPELNQRLNLIRHLIQNSEQILLVLAEISYGKTSLLNQLRHYAKQHHEHWWICAPTSSPALSPEALMSTILSAFNVRHEGKSPQVLQDSLRSHVAATRYNGQLPILMIDDAHLLPLATLRTVIELAMQGEPQTRMRVALFCEPQITSILATPEFEIVHNTLIHTIDIPALTKAQVRDYILFRLKGVHYGSIHPFTNEVISKMFTQTEGAPGKINLLAQQVLIKFVEQRPSLFKEVAPHIKLIWSGMIILLLVGMALGVYWLYPNLFAGALESHSPEMLPLAVHTTPLKKEEISKEDSKPLPTLSAPTSVAPPADLAVLNQAPVTNDTQHTEIKDESWLREQNPEAYTLQLLGAHDYTALKKFLTDSPLENVAIIKTIYRDRDWYVLVHGIFPDRDTALAAIATLPTALHQDTQPWPRTFESVQKSLANK